jgi:hyperosmotically inducible periplasmic protein
MKSKRGFKIFAAATSLLWVSGFAIAEDRSDVPSSRTEKARDADNSAVNKRDRNSKSITADDQSNKDKAVDLTAKIRGAIVERDDLSTYAHNIKIITDKSGSVTLRGPVRNEKERQVVSEIARNIAGGNVRNELEIEPKKEG